MPDRNSLARVMIVLPELDDVRANSWEDLLASRLGQLRDFAGFLGLAVAEEDYLPGVGSIVIDRADWLKKRRRLLSPKIQKSFAIEGGVFRAGAVPDDKSDQLQRVQAIGGLVARAACDKVLVGVLDSGHDQKGHPLNLLSFRRVNRAGSLLEEDAVDHHMRSHGTRVCGILAGMNGVVPSTPLAVAAVLGRRKANALQVMKGLNWLLTFRFRSGYPPGCDVINASFDVHRINKADRRGIIQQLRNAEIRFKLIVSAVGNKGGGDGLGPFANRRGAVAVGALVGQDHKLWAMGNKCEISPRGKKPNVCAPGITSSFATPMVTGVCARLIQDDSELRLNRDALVTALFERLQDTVVNQPRDLECRMLHV